MSDNGDGPQGAGQHRPADAGHDQAIKPPSRIAADASLALGTTLRSKRQSAPYSLAIIDMGRHLPDVRGALLRALQRVLGACLCRMPDVIWAA